MELRSILTPVHQGHQQLVGSVQGRWPAKITQARSHDQKHLFKSASLDSRATLEIFIIQLLYGLVSHAPIMAHLCKRSTYDLSSGETYTVTVVYQNVMEVLSFSSLSLGRGVFVVRKLRFSGAFLDCGKRKS